jgi:hypothetical protein
MDKRIMALNGAVEKERTFKKAPGSIAAMYYFI